METIRVNLTPRRDERQTFSNEYASGRDRRWYIKSLPATDDTIGQGWLEGRKSVHFIRKSSQILSLKSNGNVGTNNPARFIRTFEESTDLKSLSEREKLVALMGTMKGGADLWINTTDAESYQQLRRDFLNKNWNERIQQKVIEYISHDGIKYGVLFSKMGGACYILFYSEERVVSD